MQRPLSFAMLVVNFFIVWRAVLIKAFISFQSLLKIWLLVWPHILFAINKFTLHVTYQNYGCERISGLLHEFH